MSSYIAKTIVGNEFDKIIKGITGSVGGDEKTEDNGISGEDLVAEEKRQAAADKERKAKQAKVEKEREEARQKIRDKYNIKKKDEPSTSAHGKTTTTTTTLNENKTREVYQAPSVENQGFDPVKMTTNAFNSLKEKFGWK